MKKILQRFVKEESGQSMVEYIIIAALVIIVSIAVWRGLGGTVQDKVKHIDDELNK